jgi:hypothetical protein
MLPKVSRRCLRRATMSASAFLSELSLRHIEMQRQDLVSLVGEFELSSDVLCRVLDVREDRAVIDVEGIKVT